MIIPEAMAPIEERVAMATRCRDCDSVPKVAEAGMTFPLEDGRRIQIMHNGLKMLEGGYYGQWMTDLIRLCRGHHECQEERLFHEVTRRLAPDATMIELGGFWSYYSLWFLMDRPDRQAVVIEPEPTHLEIGRGNAALNRLTPKFSPGFAGGSFSSAEQFHGEASGELTLPRYSVEHLMEREGWSSLSLLHCDIQGFETEVLESCRDLFRNGQIEWVFVSTHAHQISGDPLTHQRCLTILRECGATIEAEHDVHESFSGDGLIVARFGAAPPDWVPVELSSNRASKSLFRHLAYDLDQSLKENALLQFGQAAAVEASGIHPSIRQSGSLLTLDADGPLGRRGDTLLLPDDKVISPDIRAQAGWDLDNLKAFVSRIPLGIGYTLIDVGANIGLFSRQIAHRSPGVERFLCIEPDPDNFRALAYNLAPLANRATLFNFALGERDGEAALLRDADNIGNYSLNADAMRDRPHDALPVALRDTRAWMIEHTRAQRLLWKSDTQGSDELIVAETPIDIWDRIDVALMEMWRIAKPPFDVQAFRDRIGSFPNRRLGGADVSTDDVLNYLAGDDWQFQDLLLWR